MSGSKNSAHMNFLKCIIKLYKRDNRYNGGRNCLKQKERRRTNMPRVHSSKPHGNLRFIVFDVLVRNESRKRTERKKETVERTRKNHVWTRKYAHDIPRTLSRKIDNQKFVNSRWRHVSCKNRFSSWKSFPLVHFRVRCSIYIVLPSLWNYILYFSIRL